MSTDAGFAGLLVRELKPAAQGRNGRSCPEAEVRLNLRLARERNPVSEDTGKPMILGWFGSEIRLARLLQEGSGFPKPRAGRR
jgi:hypothetical protein